MTHNSILESNSISSEKLDHASVTTQLLFYQSELFFIVFVIKKLTIKR
tara:strand:+ start:77 stop:220 length:144 start_codon:yes stop_codon:yes gene_type:complete